MKLSTKGRYGARAALELAIRFGSGPIMVKEIAANQGVSERYLEHILNTLRTAKLVKSTRGAKGGYELARHPSSIMLGEIVRALEGPMDIVPCIEDGDCPRMADCVMFSIWKDVKMSIDRVLDNITLQDMVMKDTELHRLANSNI